VMVRSFIGALPRTNYRSTTDALAGESPAV
jgi:hypothetical protein